MNFNFIFSYIRSKCNQDEINSISNLIEIPTSGAEKCLCVSSLRYLEKVRSDCVFCIENFLSNGWIDHDFIWENLKSSLEENYTQEQIANGILYELDILKSQEQYLVNIALNLFRNNLLLEINNIIDTYIFESPNLIDIQAILVSKIINATKFYENRFLASLREITPSLIELKSDWYEYEETREIIQAIENIERANIMFATFKIFFLKNSLRHNVFFEALELKNSFIRCFDKMYTNIENITGNVINSIGLSVPITTESIIIASVITSSETEFVYSTSTQTITEPITTVTGIIVTTINETVKTTLWDEKTIIETVTVTNSKV
ncbi:hypothetical protein A0H76_658 [Hepatospora eriocheir]|uniref:Uncharacterized protein n=1 Tax=Hepatospora eriocheir TaxID=1081669 RepID=A0A1X0QIE5_9MICR|nr:hypothetical protein A0H76_658 [Hepatospora eriocheir]